MEPTKNQDSVSSKIICLLRDLGAQTLSIQEALNALLKQSVTLPLQLITQIEGFVAEHSELGFEAKEDFVIDDASFRLDWLNSNNEHLEIPREQYGELNEAVKVMGTPFYSAEEFLQSQIDDILEKYRDHVKNKR